MSKTLKNNYYRKNKNKHNHKKTKKTKKKQMVAGFFDTRLPFMYFYDIVLPETEETTDDEEAIFYEDVDEEEEEEKEEEKEEDATVTRDGPELPYDLPELETETVPVSEEEAKTNNENETVLDGLPGIGVGTEQKETS